MSLTLSNKIQGVIATLIVLGILWLGFSAFFGLVSDLYHFLDQFIWAVFAAIIAVWAAIVLSIIIIYISVFIAAGLIYITAATFILFGAK